MLTMLVGTQMARRLEVDTLVAAGYAPEHVKQTSHSRWTSSSPYLSRVTWNLARGLRRYCRTMAVDDMVSRIKEDLEEETDSNKTYGSTNLVSVCDGDRAARALSPCLNSRWCGCCSELLSSPQLGSPSISSQAQRTS